MIDAPRERGRHAGSSERDAALEHLHDASAPLVLGKLFEAARAKANQLTDAWARRGDRRAVRVWIDPGLAAVKLQQHVLPDFNATVTYQPCARLLLVRVHTRQSDEHERVTNVWAVKLEALDRLEDELGSEGSYRQLADHIVSFAAR